MSNVVAWFEIPALDFERAVNFYSQILGEQIAKDEFLGVPHGFMLDGSGESRGAIIHNPDHQPGSSGPLLYLHAVDGVDTVVSRVTDAGGSVELPTTSIEPQGFMSIFIDSEGNRVGLHAMTR